MNAFGFKKVIIHTSMMLLRQNNRKRGSWEIWKGYLFIGIPLIKQYKCLFPTCLSMDAVKCSFCIQIIIKQLQNCAMLHCKTLGLTWDWLSQITNRLPVAGATLPHLLPPHSPCFLFWAHQSAKQAKKWASTTLFAEVGHGAC